MSARHVETKMGAAESPGFCFDYAPPSNNLRVRAWGYWTVQVAGDFERECRVACGGVARRLQVELDATGLKPQGAEGQEALRGLLQRLAELTPSGISVQTDNVLVRMQLTRLARECGVDAMLTVKT